MNSEKARTIKTLERSKRAKKKILIAVTALVAAALGTTTAFADSGFVGTAEAALTTVVILIGGGLGGWGIVNLLEAYGDNNPAGKSQGIKQAVAGAGLIIVGATIVPAIFST